MGFSENDSLSSVDLVRLLALALEDENGQTGESANRFDHYEIVRRADGSLVELGQGSMGTTYLAIDLRLGISVALKVIEHSSSETEAGRLRFSREAQVAARLRHPHIANVLYFGVPTDGRCFYAMEFVDGETLAERIQRTGPLSPALALGILAQVADALITAARHRLVHRDLKPANLMLVNEPQTNVKVIDFGLAKVVSEPDQRNITSGFVGTPAYASPEQLSGGPVDVRSDYYSLGCTLWFLLTGRLPRFGLSPGDEPSQKLLRPVPGVPAPLQRLLTSLLSVDPEKRPQTAEAVSAAIAQCQAELKPDATRKTKRVFALSWREFAIIGLLIAAVVFWRVQFGSAASPSIAVLPFTNLTNGPDKQYLSSGIQNEILSHLAKVKALHVISEASVRSFERSRPSSAEIGSQLRVKYLLEGAVQQQADRVSVQIELVEAASGRDLWAREYDGGSSDILSIEQRVAAAVLDTLQVEVSPEEKVLIESPPTKNVTAYDLYLRADEILRNYVDQGKNWDTLFETARLLSEATAEDPDFALGWCRLAQAHDNLYWYNADRSANRVGLAEQALKEAERIAPDAGETHLAKAIHLFALGRDYPAIRQELDLAKKTLPNSDRVLEFLARVDEHQGRWLDAWNDFQAALRLNPRNSALVLNLIDLYRLHRQFPQIAALFDRAKQAGVSDASLAGVRAACLWQEKGDVSGFEALFKPDSTSPLRQVGQGTPLKIQCALARRDYKAAEAVLAADGNLEFEAGEKKFFYRDFLMGGIKRAEGDLEASRAAFARARPYQAGNVDRWPDDPGPLMILAQTDAGMGNKQQAIEEACRAVAMQLSKQDLMFQAPLLLDLAEVYVHVGEHDQALKELESIAQMPRAISYGFMATMPDWDDLRKDPRFDRLLKSLGPISFSNPGPGAE